jgi:tryptophan 2,3-dioxygenase
MRVIPMGEPTAHRVAEDDFARPILDGSGGTDYERYLRTDELLALQKDAHARVHRDELLFQTVHQSSELWLKLAAAEVGEAAATLARDDLGGAARLLRRGVLCLEYVTTQLGMLGQMSPWDYQQIRVVLGHGSGFDSPGFRSIASVNRRLSDAFERLVADRGTSLLEIYQTHPEGLYEVAELLTDWDERLWLWRARHYSAVVRALGERATGTQGTPVEVLAKLLGQRRFPALWHVRGDLVDAFDGDRQGEIAPAAGPGEETGAASGPETPGAPR